MFRKLRLRLTLINGLVMAVLCFLLITGTYLIMDAQIFNQSKQLMQVIATDAGSGVATDSIRHDRAVPKYFYAKTNGAGELSEISADAPLTFDQVKSLVQKTLGLRGPQGEVEFQDTPYTFLRAPLKDAPGQVIVYVNLERDHEILGILLGTLVLGGLIYLALAFYGSLFLADRALIPIKRSWQRQQDFVADASHELRTPLTVIQTSLELVRGNPQETVEDQSKWLENIQIETKRMSKLVDDLLFLARADSNQQPLDMKNFNLSSMLQSTLESLEAIASRQDINFKASIEEIPIFYGDESRLRQLIVILLDNALKHTPAKGIIRLNAVNTVNSVEITVTDTGEGIEPEHLKKIFERFYRVDKARSKQTGGTGLGLSIADWIVNSHHGSMCVTSRIGEGTKFVVILPHLKKQA